MAYLSHFCTRKHRRNPHSLIESNYQLPDSPFVRAKRDTDEVLKSSVPLLAGFGLALLSLALFPAHARAFWLFSMNADAAAMSAPIPDSATPALKAAVNVDPNPDKGVADTLQTSGNRALIASAGPGGTVASVVGQPSSDRISVYVVRRGDTLSDIAAMFDVSVNTILWANDLRSARDVKPGDTLVILPITGVERTIAKGDTLKSLAKKYNADAEEIAQFNGLDPDEPLKVGSTIIIPGGEIVVPAPAPSTRPESQPAIIPPVSNVFLAGYFSNPVPGGRVTQGIHGKNGIDIAAPRGTPVHAAADGVVIVARGGGAWNGGYGNYIVITHPNGTQTLYSHLRSVAVSRGQSVISGQTIGHIGATGRSTGVHLHFEVRGAQNPFIRCPIGSICAPQ